MREVQTRWEAEDARPAMIFDDAKNLAIESLVDSGPAVWLNNVFGAFLRGNRTSAARVFVRVSGPASGKIVLAANDLEGIANPVQLSGAPADAVTQASRRGGCGPAEHGPRQVVWINAWIGETTNIYGSEFGLFHSFFTICRSSCTRGLFAPYLLQDQLDFLDKGTTSMKFAGIVLGLCGMLLIAQVVPVGMVDGHGGGPLRRAGNRGQHCTAEPGKWADNPSYDQNHWL